MPRNLLRGGEAGASEIILASSSKKQKQKEKNINKLYSYSGIKKSSKNKG
jgi:hypothetical protein